MGRCYCWCPCSAGNTGVRSPQLIGTPSWRVEVKAPSRIGAGCAQWAGTMPERDFRLWLYDSVDVANFAVQGTALVQRDIPYRYRLWCIGCVLDSPHRPHNESANKRESQTPTAYRVSPFALSPWAAAVLAHLKQASSLQLVLWRRS